MLLGMWLNCYLWIKQNKIRSLLTWFKQGATVSSTRSTLSIFFLISFLYSQLLEKPHAIFQSCFDHILSRPHFVLTDHDCITFLAELTIWHLLYSHILVFVKHLSFYICRFMKTLFLGNSGLELGANILKFICYMYLIIVLIYYKMVFCCLVCVVHWLLVLFWFNFVSRFLSFVYVCFIFACMYFWVD
jgi:hypothetical protein